MIDTSGNTSPTIIYGRPPRIRCFFAIAAQDLNVDECTQRIGLAPSDVWRQKHDHLKFHPDIPNTEWVVETSSDSLRSTSEAIGILLERIWPKRDIIKKFLEEKGLNASITCSVTIKEDRPLYDLAPDILAKLASLGVEFGFDIYDYSE